MQQIRSCCAAAPQELSACRGRKERSSFAASFSPAYHFRLLFVSSSQIFPIMGACRMAYPGPWEVCWPSFDA